jgi:hypothetical protein
MKLDFAGWVLVADAWDDHEVEVVIRDLAVSEAPKNMISQCVEYQFDIPIDKVTGNVMPFLGRGLGCGFAFALWWSRRGCGRLYNHRVRRLPVHQKDDPADGCQREKRATAKENDGLRPRRQARRSLVILIVVNVRPVTTAGPDTVGNCGGCNTAGQADPCWRERLNGVAELDTRPDEREQTLRTQNCPPVV